MSQAENAQFAAELAELLAKRQGPGIVVLSRGMRLLYVNQQTWALLRGPSQVPQANGGRPNAEGVLPKDLFEMVKTLFDHLQRQQDAKSWEHVEIRRLLTLGSRPLLIRAFGVPGSRTQHEDRVVVHLEGLARRKQRPHLNAALCENYGLTPRERDVLYCLAKGRVNKEIATELNISVPTVKEHLKRIMQKTSCTTRSEVLIKFFTS